MAFIHPFDHEYEDWVRLAARYKHDGKLVPKGEVLPGDFCYISDGPRIILEVDEWGNFGLPDTGGPITGGWTRGEKLAYRGGRDHFMAKVDYAESELHRWQRRRGRKHPA